MVETKTQKAITIQKETGKKVVVEFPHNLLAEEIVNVFNGKPSFLFSWLDKDGKLIEKENIRKAKPAKVVTSIVTVGLDGKEKIEVVQVEELKKKGACFATIEVEKDLSNDMLKKSRLTKEPNPYISETKAIERYKVEVILNCIWKNTIENTRNKTGGFDTGYEVKEGRSNQIENYKDSRVACHKYMKDGEERFYINYVVFNYLEERTITDTDGNIIDPESLKQYMKKTDKQKETAKKNYSEKVGIAVEFLPQIRQMKMSNIKNINVFGKKYRPKN